MGRRTEEGSRITSPTWHAALPRSLCRICTGFLTGLIRGISDWFASPARSKPSGQPRGGSPGEAGAGPSHHELLKPVEAEAQRLLPSLGESASKKTE